MLIAGCIFPQIGNHCDAHEEQLNTVVSIAPHGYRIFSIDLFGILPEDYPEYVIFIKTDGHPINLKILDRWDYIQFVNGKSL